MASINTQLMLICPNIGDSNVALLVKVVSPGYLHCKITTEFKTLSYFWFTKLL